MTTILIGALIAMSMLSAQESAPTQQAQRSTAQNVDKGRAAYMNAGCYTCHGTVGQGGAGARLAPKPRAMAGFMAYVRSGRPGWSVTGGMPAYSANVLSDAALADIYAYLSSIPAPRGVVEIPLLKD